MENQPPTQLSFHYIKSSQFRVVHSDGFIGGITPRGLLHVAIYSERASIPQLVVHDVVTDGNAATLGAEAQRLGKDGYTRELEVDLMMDEPVVRALHEWLSQRLKEFDEINKAKVAGK